MQPGAMTPRGVIPTPAVQSFTRQLDAGASIQFAFNSFRNSVSEVPKVTV